MLVFVLQFYGGAVKAPFVIELSDRVLNERGGREVLDSLVSPNIRHRRAFTIYADWLDLWDSVKAGRYELRQGMDVIDIVRMLKLGLQTPLNVTFTSARGMDHLAGKLAKQIEPDSLALLEAFRSADLAASMGLKEEEMLAIFIPNTYQLWWTVTPEELVKRMNVEYDRFWTPAREEARKALNLSRVEVSTLASIVVEESAKVDEMPRIAGVYINRLRRGIKLQADPTVKFAIGDSSIKRVLNKHLTYDSPYNTYKHKGLPPGPIAVASIAAINAVLNYEKHNYIYFCARPEFDGYHNFASTYSKHLENARAYSAELNRRGIK